MVVFRIRGEFTQQEQIEAVEMMENIVKDKENILVLCNISDLVPKLDKSVRQSMKDHPKKFKFSKMALVATNPAVRMIGKVVLATMGSDFSASFFKTEEEAIRWLKGG